MPIASQKVPTRSDDLLLVGSDPAPTVSQVGRPARPEHLQSILNYMCTLMLRPDAPIMPKRLAGKVFEKLIRPGRFLSVENREAPENHILSQLANEPHGPQDLASKGLTTALFQLAAHLTWTLSKAGPFASRNFENSHGHAVLVGPGGVEERNDVRIGVTILAPYTRFPDHTQYQPRAFLALSPMEFCTESESWKRLQAGEIAYSGAGEVVAMRCTTKPLLMLWCNAERR